MNNQHSNDEVISTLNSLIETCKDGEEGFRAAGDAVENQDVRTLFHLLGQQRARFAAELNSEVLHHGGQPVESGHISASLHRGWMHLRTAIAGKSESAIIDECERGEDAAMSAYQDALKKQLPSDLLSIVEDQYAAVREAHSTVRDLKRAAHAA
jgi:uncharacterized protein (TIGR02284 family)